MRQGTCPLENCWTPRSPLIPRASHLLPPCLYPHGNPANSQISVSQLTESRHYTCMWQSGVRATIWRRVLWARGSAVAPMCVFQAAAKTCGGLCIWSRASSSLSATLRLGEKRRLPYKRLSLWHDCREAASGGREAAALAGWMDEGGEGFEK